MEQPPPRGCVRAGPWGAAASPGTALWAALQPLDVQQTLPGEHASGAVLKTSPAMVISYETGWL